MKLNKTLPEFCWRHESQYPTRYVFWITCWVQLISYLLVLASECFVASRKFPQAARVEACSQKAATSTKLPQFIVPCQQRTKLPFENQGDRFMDVYESWTVLPLHKCFERINADASGTGEEWAPPKIQGGRDLGFFGFGSFGTLWVTDLICIYLQFRWCLGWHVASPAQEALKSLLWGLVQGEICYYICIIYCKAFTDYDAQIPEGLQECLYRT